MALSNPTARRAPGSWTGRAEPCSVLTLCRRIDHFPNFRDLGRGESADLSMLADDRLVLGEVDAKGLVFRHIALQPLDIGPELPQDAVRFRSGAAKLFAREGPDLWNVALYDEFAQCHDALRNGSRAKGQLPRGAAQLIEGKCVRRCDPHHTGLNPVSICASISNGSFAVM